MTTSRLQLYTNLNCLTMHTIERKFLSLLKIALKGLISQNKLFDGISHNFEDAQVRGQDASDLIKNRILTNRPLMVARFGATELTFLTTFLVAEEKSWWLRKRLYYVLNKIRTLDWERSIIDDMVDVSGFFPYNLPNAHRYTDLVLEDVREIDILGSWLYRERLLKSELRHVIKVQLPDLEPYYHSNPWSEALVGKKILVVHPFKESIQKQYLHRQHLFTDSRVLPDFELDTIRAVQSAGQTKTQFADWFQSLDHMKAQMDQKEYDIAIIGCGAYGFHLAAHAKRSQKIGIHLGGATQMLFGIKGKRWENNPGSKDLMNEYWVKPSDSERPEKFNLIENGCYW